MSDPYRPPSAEVVPPPPPPEFECSACGAATDSLVAGMCSDCMHDLDDEVMIAAKGNFWLGIVLGLVVGLWGLIGASVFGGLETQRGSKWGFLARIVLIVLFVLVEALLR